MPSLPRTDKGEGFVRSYELLEQLYDDVISSYKHLDENRDSQHLRRCAVRAIYSYIEAIIESVKNEIRSTVRKSDKELKISEKDKELLGSLSPISCRREEKKHNLIQNIKRTFKLAKKVWKLDNYAFYTDGQEFECFLRSKDARNRLMHPKTYYDIQVTQEDMHDHTVTFDWAHSEFQNLIKKRLESIANELPEDVARKLLSRWNDN
jgi:hypothetical protein